MEIENEKKKVAILEDNFCVTLTELLYESVIALTVVI